jgi:hypothetical protein
MLKTKSERLEIVLDICKKLRKFPTAEHPLLEVYESHLNLYDSDYEAIIKLKKILSDYVNQDDNSPHLLTGFSGKIKFTELNRTIHYILPIKSYAKHIIVFKH